MFTLSDNCSDDYVSVYDGMSTLSPLIGRFCGQEGAHLVSSGSSLLMIFESGPGGPPWDYSGFKLETTYRWKSKTTSLVAWVLHPYSRCHKYTLTLLRSHMYMALIDLGDYEGEGGFLDKSTMCDWTFRSSDSDLDEGEIHTPDHRTVNNTECVYTFQGNYNEKVEIELTILKLA